ncbi:protein spaetzle 4 [Eurosta solidaginis]|uniref:protein spaetzle 4 n=1 Tax=Eurosta solidaginis TaxID=178769 RepID=UPI0035308446
MEYINMDKRFKISKTLIIYFIFLLLFIVAISRPNDAYGYDSANSCTAQESKQARRGRAQMLAAIPCDLTRQDYCHLPGSAYPWHAVRRFVHENHGLMKRMYGDVRHILVLRDEILNNEIDENDYEDVAERYSKKPHRIRAAKYMQAQHENHPGSIRSNDDITEPHFRPVSTTITTTTTPVVPKETIVQESTSAANERKEAKMSDERPSQKRTAGGAYRRRFNTTTNIGSGHRRRVNVYINRNRPLHSSLRRRNTTTTTTEEPKLDVENTEQASEITMKDETVFQISGDDGNIASNSVYEISTSPEAPLFPGDNIQIIESPQLGQLQKPLTEQNNNSEMATISTILKVVTTSATKERPPLNAAVDAPARTAATPLQEIPAHEEDRQRPPQTIKLHQLRKQNATTELNTKKESSILKLQAPNERDRLQSDVSLSVVSSTTTEYALKGNANEFTDVNTKKGSVGVANMDPDSVWTLMKSTTTLAPALKNSILLQYDENDGNKSDLAQTTLSKQTTTVTMPASIQTDKPTNSINAADTNDEEVEAHVVQITIDEKQHSSQELSQSTSAQTTPPNRAIAAASTKPVLREGQLYQDAIKQEVMAPPNVRGINACPGKEEVVAPFWANNTRGEILALLNLYPFEQYIHWEKCTQENRQMYCREGCRCEQQYRLHRLLAYDPHNECRGIFSDWFRFPSCCICKCYGMPVEFRATSRSPRSERMDDFETVSAESDYEEDLDDSIGSGTQHQRLHPFDAAEQLVRQAIYEHATEDWYRPRDDFDFYED